MKNIKWPEKKSGLYTVDDLKFTHTKNELLIVPNWRIQILEWKIAAKII